MGEHAVVYGEPAVVAAVDLRLRARFGGPGRPGSASCTAGTSEANGGIELRLRGLGYETRLAWPDVLAYAAEARDRWEAFEASPGTASFARLRGRDLAHLLKVALGEAAAHLGETAPPPLSLEVDSELPIGSGLGSSAALAAAVAGGYLAWRGRRAEPCELEALALEIERRQHGTPSGVDGAAVLRGGIVWAEWSGAGALEFRGLSAAGEHLRRFSAFDTGAPADSTGAVVAAVRERVEAHPDRLGASLRDMGRTTRRFRDALAGPSSPEEVVRLLRRFERGLEALGVVPEPARRLVRAIEERGGAAKISGAGALRSPARGPACAGSLLVYHPEPGHVEEWGLLAGLSRHPFRLGAEGFRIEDR